ncbi:ANK REP REGION domain-containing protein [Citrus sinensis]|uniref:ANK REP REGION domain-containing protein n=1 Tax=Citrus sinensis TaxID=2711 RepID=A0ACB8HWD9_CITSI|nr:ANK REP REGION domain-containing protein [Citrus sinensis]
MANLEKLFQEACQRNDVEGVKSLNSKHPNLLDEIIKACQRSDDPLLITACLPGSLEVAKEMARLWPQLASIKNQRGETTMHLLSTDGDAETVRIFGEINRELCLEVDNSSMIPLHRAALDGNSDVIRALVSICPESLEKLTSNGETALHLAVKKSRSDAFEALVDEAKNHRKEHLFTWKDKEGNTVLHLATLNKLKQIVELLIRENSNRRIMIRINTVNKEGQTTLQLCNANSQDSAFKEIGWIIQRAIAQQSPQLPADGAANSSRNQTRWPMQTRNVLLMVVVTIAAAFFMVACHLPDSLVREDTLAVKTLHADEDDVLSKLPTVVYIMIFNSAGFLTTMFAIVLLVWPLHLRTFVLFLVICTAIVYILLVDEIIPKFYVKVGKSSILSNGLVWSLVLALILFGMSILSMGKFTLSFWRFIIRLWMNRTNRRGNSHEDLREITAL